MNRRDNLLNQSHQLSQKNRQAPQHLHLLNHRLILIEGIPGSGKTTLSARLEAWLNEQGIHTVLYREGDAHPADMAWNALLSQDEFEQVKKEQPHLAEKLDAFAQPHNDQITVAYTKIGYENVGPELWTYFEAHEVYDGRVPLDIFESLHVKRWANFADMALANPETVYLFECSFLQNHVNELMSAHLKTEDDILLYLNRLSAPVMPLNPLLLYLDQSDTDETIRRVAAARVSPPESNRPDWITMVIAYVESSRYAKKNGLVGYDGALQFIRERKAVEMVIWPHLQMDRVIIPNASYDWDTVFTTMTRAVTET